MTRIRKRTAISIAMAAMVAAPVLAEPLNATLLPIADATNSGSFTIKNITDESCLDDDSCREATSEIFIDETSSLGVTFNRNDTTFTLVDTSLTIPNFALVFGPLLTLNVEDASIVTNPDLPVPTEVIGGNAGPFNFVVPALLNATIRLGNSNLTFPVVDEPSFVEVAGNFAFDPVEGSISATEIVGGVDEIPYPLGDSYVLQISGGFQANFDALGVLDIFEESFDGGDFGGWSSVTPPPA